MLAAKRRHEEETEAATREKVMLSYEERIIADVEVKVMGVLQVKESAIAELNAQLEESKMRVHHLEMLIAKQRVELLGSL